MLCGQQAVEERMAAQRAQRLEDGRLQGRFGLFLGLGCGDDLLHDAARLAQHRLGDQVIAGGEVLVEGLPGEPGPLGHVADREPAEAVHGRNLQRRVQQPFGNRGQVFHVDKLTPFVYLSTTAVRPGSASSEPPWSPRRSRRNWGIPLVASGRARLHGVRMPARAPIAATPDDDADLIRTASRRPPPDPTSAQRRLAVVVASAVGLFIGVAIEVATNWVNRASSEVNQFEGLGRALLSLAIGVPLTLGVTAALFRCLPLRSRFAAGTYALFTGFSLREAMFDFGLITHTSHASWPAAPLAFGFGLAAWVFLPGRSSVAGAAAVLGVLVLAFVSPKVKSARFEAETERAIAAAGFPIATTSVPRYHLQSAYAEQQDERLHSPAQLSLVFARESSDRRNYEHEFTVHITHRPRAFEPPSRCEWIPSYFVGQPDEAVPCTKVAPDVWWIPRTRTVVTEYHGALVSIRSSGIKPIAESVLVDAARHLHPTTAHDLVHSAKDG